MNKLRCTMVAVAALAVLAAGTLAWARGSDTAQPYHLTGRQAEEVATAIAFVDAFNARDLNGALRVLAANAGVSDCDYAHVRAVEAQGKQAIGNWLRKRFADRDHLVVAAVLDENPDQPVGVTGIEYSRRTSATLARLGFPHGITPTTDTKVVFARTEPVRIVSFANGPVGGPASLCEPH